MAEEEIEEVTSLVCIVPGLVNRALVSGASVQQEWPNKETDVLLDLLQLPLLDGSSTFVLHLQFCSASGRRSARQSSNCLLSENRETNLDKNRHGVS